LLSNRKREEHKAQSGKQRSSGWSRDFQCRITCDLCGVNFPGWMPR
jgi:hypothetical protein